MKKKKKARLWWVGAEWGPMINDEFNGLIKIWTKVEGCGVEWE